MVRDLWFCIVVSTVVYRHVRGAQGVTSLVYRMEFKDLPEDVIPSILAHVGPDDLLTRVPAVCKLWRTNSKCDFVWGTKLPAGIVRYAFQVILIYNICRTVFPFFPAF